MDVRHPVAAALLALGSLALSGCSSVRTIRQLHGQRLAESGETLAHVHAGNWGVYVLFVPVVTGSVDWPGSIVVGQDTVHPEAVASMVTARSAALRATKTLDLRSSASSFWIWPVFQIKSAEASGNAVR